MKAAFLLALIPAFAQAAAVNTEHQLVARDANGINLDEVTNATPLNIESLNVGDIIDTFDDSNVRYVGRAKDDGAQIFQFSNGDFAPIILDIAGETDCPECDQALAAAPAPDAEAIANKNGNSVQKRTGIILALLKLKLDFIFGCGQYDGWGAHINFWEDCVNKLRAIKGAWFRQTKACLLKLTYAKWDFFHWFAKEVRFSCGKFKGVFRKGHVVFDGCDFGSTIGIDKGYYVGDCFGRSAWRHVGQRTGRYSFLSCKKGPRRHGYELPPKKNVCNVCNEK